MTAQEPEILIFNGKKMMMTTNPSIDENVVPKPFGLGLRTSNYRGYIGTWEIKDGKLYLNDVEGGYMKEKPIFADWVSHELRVWNGNLLRYVHAGYGSMYEEDIIFEVENGVVQNIRTKNNVEEYKKQAIQEVQDSSNKTNISFLYSIYLDPNGELSRLIGKSTDRREEYIALQKELEVEFQKRLQELAQDPESGIKLVYR
jgi:hypothetical protein